MQVMQVTQGLGEPVSGAAVSRGCPARVERWDRRNSACGAVAAITVADAAIASLVHGLVNGVGAAVASVGDRARVWIVDESVAVVELQRYVAGAGCRNAVVRLGGPVGLGPRVLAVQERGVALGRILARVLETSVEVGAEAEAGHSSAWATAEGGVPCGSY